MRMEKQSNKNSTHHAKKQELSISFLTELPKIETTLIFEQTKNITFM